MFKMELFDWAINEKCYSVDGGRGICPLFLTAQKSPSPGICHPRQKNANAPESAPGGGGGSWTQVELTDAL